MALKMNTVPGGGAKKKTNTVYNPNPLSVAGSYKPTTTVSTPKTTSPANTGVAVSKPATTTKPTTTISAVKTTAPVSTSKTNSSSATKSVSKGSVTTTNPGNSNVINNNTQNNGSAGINRDFGSNNERSGGDSTNSGSSIINSGTNGTTGTTESTLPNYYEDLIKKFEEDNEKARQDALNALEATYNTNKGKYENQLSELGDKYDALRNQSEVERYKTRAAMREALANRGQLDSGYGRQENLILDTKYGNAINSINMQEAKARQDIQNMISQLLAEKEYNRNTINNEYNEKRQNALNTLRGYLA